MVYRGNITEQDYRDAPGINQSYLKLLPNVGLFNAAMSGVIEEHKLYFEEKAHFKLGTAVDDFITRGKEYFDFKYFIPEDLIKSPSDTIKSITKSVFDKYGITNLGTAREYKDLAEQVWESCNAHEYYMNRRKSDWKEDGRLAKIIEEGQEYWNQLIKSNGKVILDSSENKLVNTIVENLLGHDFTKGVFEEEPGVDIIYQLGLFFELLGIPCKALLDGLIVDHNQETIRGFDIKTLADFTRDFPKSMKKRRYDFQAAFYEMGIRRCLRIISEIVGKDILQYQILPFIFVVESTQYPGTPLVFETTFELINNAIYGFYDVLTGKHVYGVNELVSILEWHIVNGYNFDKDIYENGGTLKLTWYEN